MKRKLLLFLTFICLTTTAFSQNVTLVGGFQGWNLGNGVPFTTTDNVNYTLANIVIVPANEAKIVVNASWDTAYGAATAPGFPSGTGTIGPTNISISSGTWNIAFNVTTKAYSFTPGVNPNAVFNLTGTGLASPITMSTENGTDYIARSVTVTSGNLSFSQDGTSNVWGNASFPSGIATMGGAPVVLPNGGTWNIAFNKNTGAYAFTPTEVGMIGAGSPSGSWDIDAMMTSTDAIHYSLPNAVIAGGTMKIRDNHLWTYQFGAPGATADTPFPDGTALAGGGDMLTLSGTYDITFNRTTGAYSFGPDLSTAAFNAKSLQIYPNPTAGSWNINSEVEAMDTIQIMDVTGKTVKTIAPKGNLAIVDASSLTSGVYFARIATASAVTTIKLVKE